MLCLEDTTVSRRRQTEIPGTERTEHPDITEAAEQYRATRDERSEMSKREARQKLELLAVMRAHKLKLYRYHDGSGEEQEVVVDDEPRVKLRKTNEAEPEIGEGIDDGEVSVGPATNGVHDGLIAQALKSQEEQGIVETADGDVGVAEQAPKKRKRVGVGAPKGRKSTRAKA